MKQLIALILICSAASLSLAFDPAADHRVYIIKTTDRSGGIAALIAAAGLPDLAGKKVVIKPNFNSDDPFPATTHLDTLKAAIEFVKAASPESLVIAERSGMGETEEVLDNRGVLALAVSAEVGVINLDALEAGAWVVRGTKGTHWQNGVMIPQVVAQADYLINLPCLKTHRFGGDFTMSLKNNVGLVAKWYDNYNYMYELHSSDDQRLMIAEINREMPPQIIIMDGLKGFATGGPDQGELIEPGVLLLATDPVAIDAVGVAILRSYGTTEKVSRGKILEQDQLRRAAEQGIGTASAEAIEIVPVNKEAVPLVKRIKKELLK